MAEVVETQRTVKGRIVYIPEIDKTLTKDGYSADAKTVGDKINLLAEVIKNIEGSGMGLATGVLYDNTNSGIDATTVQNAIDELVTALNNYSQTLTALNTDALRKSTGGMMKGTFMVQNADNGYGSFMKNNSATADYGTQFSDVSKSGKIAKIVVNALSNLLNFVDSDSNIRAIHHEGNKAFGNYSGNGSTTARTIATKGIGRLVLVYCSTHQALVTPKGANVTDLSTGETSWIDSAKVNYLSGNLNLATNNEAFNKSNETYYYQVI